MAFQNETNKGRVTKMVDSLHLILKSAQANRAGDHDIVAMLRPLTDELAALGLAADMPAAAPAPATSALTAGERAAGASPPNQRLSHARAPPGLVGARHHGSVRALSGCASGLGAGAGANPVRLELIRHCPKGQQALRTDALN